MFQLKQLHIPIRWVFQNEDFFKMLGCFKPLNTSCYTPKKPFQEILKHVFLFWVQKKTKCTRNVKSCLLLVNDVIFRGRLLSLLPPFVSVSELWLSSLHLFHIFDQTCFFLFSTVYSFSVFSFTLFMQSSVVSQYVFVLVIGMASLAPISFCLSDKRWKNAPFFQLGELI